MRIGFDAKRAFNNTSGLGNYSRNTIKLLADRYPENQYLLYTPGINGNLDFILPKGSSIKTPGSAIGKYLGPLWRSVALSGRLRRDNIDLYHGLSHDLPVGIKNLKFKKVVTIHDMIAYRHPEMFSPVNRFIYQHKIAHSCRAADMIIAISRSTKQDIMEFLDVDPSIIRVVYQTCDPLFFKTAGTSARHRVREKFSLPRNFLLSVGTIEPRKNLVSVIKAMHLGKIDMPLVVVGKKTSFTKTIYENIASFGVRHVHFLENISTEDLAVIYRLAAAFVYPSLYEGFGIPILEALCSGTPVITSTGSCFGETGGPGSLYVSPLEIEEIAAAIKMVLTDHELRQKMVDSGLDFAQNFRHGLIAEKMMDVYNMTLNSKT